MSVFRPLYDWVLRLAQGKHASKALFAVAFAESSVFPIPPDVMLLPMVLAQRERAFRLALICTLGSVLGGVLGYAIGALLLDSFGQWIIATYHLQAGFDKFQEGFNRWGVWIILAKGLTPIPFKLVTIASGVAHLNLAVFVGACVVTRAARFFLVAFLVQRFGEPIRVFVERYLTWVSLGVLAVIAGGFWFVLR